MELCMSRPLLKNIIACTTVVAAMLLSACSEREQTQAESVNPDVSSRPWGEMVRATILLGDNGEIISVNSQGKPLPRCTRESGPEQCEVFKQGVDVDVSSIASLDILTYQVNPTCILVCHGFCYWVCY